MKKFGQNLDSAGAWEDIASKYTSVIENDYHKHRLSVISALIPRELYAPGKRVFDFGCGDAVHFQEFLEAGADMAGMDIAAAMVEQAAQRLVREGYAPNLAWVGGVQDLERLPASSLDGLLSFNVLAYLTAGEEETFYGQAARILKPDGYLIVTHSNELFDMFTLNRSTREFMKRHLMPDPAFHEELDQLFTPAGLAKVPTTYNVRENPLTYRYKLSDYGFEEIRQEFINLHHAPPAILWDEQRLRELNVKENDSYGNIQTYHKTYPPTLGLPERERWKLMFTCSTYGSTSRRVAPQGN